MAFFGLFSSSRALRVTDAGVTPVPEAQRIHPTQQFQRTWTIASGTNVAESCRLTKLALETPGLTIVRVRPELRRDDATAVARVVVSSDAAAYLERVALNIKHKSELRVVFTNLPNATSQVPLGVLVVEIELAHASLLDEIKATGGGDVVVEDDAALTRHADASVSLVALDRSRLFVTSDDNNDVVFNLTLQHLRVASVSGGSVFFSTNGTLQSHTHVVCGVLGDGRVVVRAARIETNELMVAVVGDRGHAQIEGSAGGDIEATKAEMVVVGTGSIVVQTSPSPSSPSVNRDAVVACERLNVEMTGAGSVDVAAIAARAVHVTAKDGAHATVHARETLTMACEGDATSVECVGDLPPHVEPVRTEIPPNRLRVTPYENRVWTASETVPEAPTSLTMFTAPRVLAIEKIGFRETLRPLWTTMSMSSHWASRTTSDTSDASSAPVTPTWVRVMDDAASDSKSAW